jgi:hypothetical protein
VPGDPTATRTGQGVASADGQTLFVRSGSDLVGPLYPAQPARLLIVDVNAKSLIPTIEIGGYGLGHVFLASSPPANSY